MNIEDLLEGKAWDGTNEAGEEMEDVVTRSAAGKREARGRTTQKGLYFHSDNKSSPPYRYDRTS